MRESVRSLRVYLGIAGVVGLVLNTVAVLNGEAAAPRALAVFYMVFNVASLYASVTLPRLLRKRRAATQAVFQIYELIATLRFAIILVAAISQRQPMKSSGIEVVSAFVALALARYLNRNVKRLVAESAGELRVSSA